MQDQLVTLQQLLEAARITLECILGGQPSTTSVEEAHIVHPVLTELAVGCRMLQIRIDAIELPTPELQ